MSFPPLATVGASLIAIVATGVLAARMTLRLQGTLTTVFGWAMAGGMGAWMLMPVFPDSSIGASPLIGGVSDHALAVGGFGLAAAIAVIGSSRLARATRTMRAAGLNPAFALIGPISSSPPVPGLTIHAPMRWGWTLRDGLPSLEPVEGGPAPLRLVLLPDAAPPDPSTESTRVSVDGIEARREVVEDGPGGTTVRYRFLAPQGGADRIVEARIEPTADAHERRAYRDCADLIAGSVRWERPPRRWFWSRPAW